MEKQFFEDEIFNAINYTEQKFILGEYENCKFINCDFASVDLSNNRFSTCDFIS